MNHIGWKLVWCCESCHKSQSNNLRDALLDICRKVGAELICLKKAAKFAAWSSSLSHYQRFALLTDWREAKPCVEAFAEGAIPFTIIIYCDSVQSFRRASAWVSQLDPKFGGHAHVCSGISDLEPVLLQEISLFYSGMDNLRHTRVEMIKKSLDFETITSNGIVPQYPMKWQSPFSASDRHSNIKAPIRIEVGSDKENQCQRWDVDASTPIKIEAVESAAEQHCMVCGGTFGVLDSILFTCRHRYHYTCADFLQEKASSEIPVRSTECHICLPVCSDMLRTGRCENKFTCTENHDKVALALWRISKGPNHVPRSMFELSSGLYDGINDGYGFSLFQSMSF